MENVFNQNTYPQLPPDLSEGEESISLRELFEIVLNNWKWFAFSIIVGGMIAWFYLYTKVPRYQRQAVIMVKEDASASSTRRSALNTNALMQLNGVMGGTSVKNELYILRSYQLMQDVVKRLGLDVTYVYKHKLKDYSLYTERPVTVTFKDEFSGPVSFRLDVTSAAECAISEVFYGTGTEKLSYTKKVAYGQEIETPFGRIEITLNEKALDRFRGESITVRRYSVEDAAIMTCNKINTSEMDKESTLVLITCQDSNIRRADDILSTILEAYKQSIIKNKNEIAQSTADFIDDRIALISIELGEVENSLANFKQRNGLVDIKSNADIFLNQTATARQRTIQAESQYTLVQYLVDYVKRNSQGNNLIPTLGGITDAGIQSQIASFNQLMLKRNNLAANAAEDNPSIVELDANLQQMRQAVVASLEGYTASLKVQLQQAQKEEKGLSSTLTTVPQKEKEFIDISRQQAIKETLFTFLLNKREETALQLAITEANISIVEHPFGSRAPVSPRKRMVMMVGLLLGALLPLAFFYVKNLLYMGVRGRKDIEAFTTIPLLGEIPHRKDNLDDAAIVVDGQTDDSLGEAFRMLRFSMGFINKDARIIMFTSTMPGEGKTFISRNFAATLGITGKRVLLVDSDIRKRTQSKLSLQGRRNGFTSYLSGAVDDLKSLIIEESKEHNVDFLPAGITPPNPAELLMSHRLEECFDQLKSMYDYVVIDNVPAQVVADAGIVNRVADMTIYVIREGRLDRRYLPELERLHQEGKFNNLCIVLNDSDVEKKKYGYGYGYGYRAEEHSKGFWGFFKRKRGHKHNS